MEILQFRKNIWLPILLVLLLSLIAISAGAAPLERAGPKPDVEVYDLRINGQYDFQLGIGDTTPVLSWRLRATPSDRSHPC